MYFVFTVQVEVERDTGKFASREELENLIAEALANADEGSWTGDDGGEYSTTTWDVQHDDAAFEEAERLSKRARRERRKKAKQALPTNFDPATGLRNDL